MRLSPDDGSKGTAAGIKTLLVPVVWRHFRFVLPIRACVLLALAVASGGIAQAGPEVKAHPRTVQVSIVTDPHTIGQYKPRTIVVHRGDRIVFRNASNAPHTVTATNNSFDSGTIDLKKSWAYTARKVGTFSYFCQFHAGMSGKIIVKPELISGAKWSKWRRERRRGVHHMARAVRGSGTEVMLLSPALVLPWPERSW